MRWINSEASCYSCLVASSTATHMPRSAEQHFPMSTSHAGVPCDWTRVAVFPWLWVDSSSPGLSCPSTDARALQGRQSRFFLPMLICSGSSHGKAHPNLELRCTSMQSEVICLASHSNGLNELLAKDVLVHFLCLVPMPISPFNVKWSAGRWK